ncbi:MULTISPECIES: hypothetical protein [Mesorhizobium]|uniref:Uncharacterized protein n=1 Tax=Mesorhizobium denitrificans TaxID=2294114 RepID=A0A371XE57_9HYPH|nr:MULTISPECIES: hypothetical protein [Mesorhizobium]RFC67521.1 hypothetical protein DY251_11020 [Mesorhizobium denitrificans]
MINLGDLFSRKDPLEKALVNLDDEMENAFNEIISHEEGEAQPQRDASATVDAIEIDETGETALEPLTPATTAPDSDLSLHAQARMAAFQAFDESHRAARDELFKIGQAFAAVIASHTHGRSFLDDCAADIARLSDLETTNAKFASDNRRFEERLDKLERLRERQEAVIESHKTREARIAQEFELLRTALNDARLEAVETKSQLASLESLRSEMQLQITAQTVDIERLNREVESLREKNVVLRLDLDVSQQKSTEYRRKLDETQTLLSVESARASDASTRLGIGESELLRLQKQSDALDSRLTETLSSLHIAEQDIADRDRRYNTELQCLRSETAQLSARLQTSKADQADKQSQLNLLETRLNEVEAERRILEHKLSHPTAEAPEAARLPSHTAPSLKEAADGQAKQMKILKQSLERAAEMKAKTTKTTKRRKPDTRSAA